MTADGSVVQELSFGAAFVRHLTHALGATLAASPEPALTLLVQRLDEAAARSPHIALAAADFASYVAERHPDLSAASAEQLAALCLGDLYLACACARGDAAALRALTQEVEAIAMRELGRLGLSGGDRQEAVQDYLSRLVVGDGLGPAKILQYRGEGDLLGWVRVSVTRFGLNLQRQRRRRLQRTPEESDEHLATLAAGQSPELEYLEKAYKEEFERAFAAAAQSLPARDRTLLQQYYFDGLDFDAIGRLYLVHRTTASRWLREALAAVLLGTQQQLRERLHVGDDTLASIMRLFGSRVEESVRQLLR